VQVVIGTEVINRTPGLPRILSVKLLVALNRATYLISDDQGENQE